VGKHRTISINNNEYWVKLLENHSSNWAVIDELPDGLGFRAWFFDGSSWIFDYLDFLSKDDAEVTLKKNHFSEYTEQEFGFLGYPEGDFQWWMPEKPSDRPYSTGKFWLA
jgi:hypothetical protein